MTTTSSSPTFHPATTRDVFSIAGPAMLANLTTPMLGIVATMAIGRLGDATLLGGVAMASVLFDCTFWLFGFLRMSTVAFTAQALALTTGRNCARCYRVASSFPAPSARC
jgi:MATE family multidrug resistance protein